MLESLPGPWPHRFLILASVLGAVGVALAAIGAQLLVSAVIAAFTGGLGGGPGFSFKDFFKLLFGSLVFAGGVGLGCFVLRTALKATGSVATDILLAGAALIPLGIALLAGAIVGKIVAALGVAVLIVGFSLTVLVLFTGFTRIGGVKEGPASYLVALTLVIGGAVSWMVGRIFS